MPNETILIIEDEENIAELVQFTLESEGYRIKTANTGPDGVEQARLLNPDLIVLDLMLPDLDGFEVCKIIRQDEKIFAVPIIMLTAKGDETDKVLGLELGADDYVAKPFSPRELAARVKAVLRRVKDKNQSKKIQVGTLTLDREKHLVLLSNKPLDLTSKEYGVLELLITSKGRLLTRTSLLERVWGYDSAVNIETRTVDMHIGQLRKKLKKESSRIVTVKNAGYRFDFERQR